jgi:CheY-like chemotaxis protein
MDLQMPEMDGLEASRLIRARECMVAMTANVMPSDREQCRASGMDGFLAKPVRAEALLSLLAAVSRGEVPAETIRN